MSSDSNLKPEPPSNGIGVEHPAGLSPASPAAKVLLKHVSPLPSPLAREYIPTPEDEGTDRSSYFPTESEKPGIPLSRASPPVINEPEPESPEDKTAFADRIPHRASSTPTINSDTSSSENLDVEAGILSLIGTFRTMDAGLVRDVLPEVYLVLAGALMRGGEMEQAQGTCDVALEKAAKRVESHTSKGRSGAAMHAVGVRNEAEKLMKEIKNVREQNGTTLHVDNNKQPRVGGSSEESLQLEEEGRQGFKMEEGVRGKLKELGLVFGGDGKVMLDGGDDDLSKDQCLYGKVKDALEDALNRSDVQQAAALLLDPRVRSAKFYYTPSKQTPLLIAANHGSHAMAELLLDNGADPNEGNVSAVTPLQIAAYNCSRPVLTPPASPSEDPEPTKPSCCGKSALSVAELLISHGADVNASCANTGDTPLHSAAAFGCTEFAKLLVSKGADIHAKNNVGNTPLHEAGEWRVKGMVEFLIDAGADKAVKNGKGETAYDLCIKGTCGGSCTEIAEILKV